MENIHSVIRNLKSRTALSKNLAAYPGFVKKPAFAFGTVNFVFSYISLLEKITDREAGNVVSGALSSMIASFSELVSSYVSGENVSVSSVEELRQDNFSYMENKTEEADAFELAEHILNRKEHAFYGETALPSSYSDEEAAENITNWVFRDGNDSANLKLSLLVQELPVRMTKNRFFELMTEGLSVYKASGETAFKDAISLLRSVSGLKELKDNENAAVFLQDLLSELRDKETSCLTKERFTELQTLLISTGADLNYRMDVSVLLEESMNAFLLMLCGGYSFTDPVMHPAAGEIIRGLSDAGNRDSQIDFDEIYKKCEALEGVSEEAYQNMKESLSFLEFIRDKYGDDIEKEGLSETYDALNMISLLTSGSDFVILKDTKKLPETPLSEEIFRLKTTELMNELLLLFNGADKMFVRSVMGKIFGKLPVRFVSAEEAENYILSSLKACKDLPEKLGVLEVLGQIMSEN